MKGTNMVFVYSEPAGCRLFYVAAADHQQAEAERARRRA